MVSVDRWTAGSQVYFLTHLHADHLCGLTSKWSRGPLYCSRITAKLFPIKFPDFDLSLLRIVEIGHWHSVSLLSPSCGSYTDVDFMAIDAHHCPGIPLFFPLNVLLCFHFRYFFGLFFIEPWVIRNRLSAFVVEVTSTYTLPLWECIGYVVVVMLTTCLIYFLCDSSSYVIQLCSSLL